MSIGISTRNTDATLAQLSPNSLSGSVTRTASVGSSRNRILRVHLKDLDDGIQVPFQLAASPKSAEALARQGLLADELVFRNLQSFASKEESSDVAEIRFKHCEARRREKLAQCRQEYERLCREDEEKRKCTSRADNSQSYMDDSQRAEDEYESHLRKQLEAMKRKQKEDIEEMLLSEFRDQKMRDLGEQKLAAMTAKEEALAEEKRRREHEWETLRLEREARKREAEALELEEQRILIDAEHQREKERRAKLELEEKRRRAEAKRKEQERTERAEGLRKHTEDIRAEQKYQAELRKQAMEEKDGLRRIAMEQQKALVAQENEMKRLQMEAKIASAVEAQQEQMERQQEMMREKERRTEERRRRFEAMREAHFQEAQQQAEEKAQRNVQLQRQMEEREEERKQTYRDKDAAAHVRLEFLEREREREEEERKSEASQREARRLAAMDRAASEEEAQREKWIMRQREADEAMRRTNEMKQREASMRLEQERLRRQDKVESVERLKRIQEHNTQKTLERIEDEDRRIAEYKNRQYLMKQEQLKAKKEAEAIKQSLQAAVEKMRKTKRWEAPSGVDLDIDIRALELRAEEMVMRGREGGSLSSTRNSSTLSVGARSRSVSAERPRTAPALQRALPQPHLPQAGHQHGPQEDQAQSHTHPAQTYTHPAQAFKQQRAQAYAQTHTRTQQTQAIAQAPARTYDKAQDTHINYIEPSPPPHSAPRNRPTAARKLTRPSSAHEHGRHASNRHNASNEERGRSAERQNGGRWAEAPWPASTLQASRPLKSAPASRAVSAYRRMSDIRRPPRTSGSASTSGSLSRRRKVGGGKATGILHGREGHKAAVQMIDALRRQQNEHLLRILQEEQAREAEREILMRDIVDMREKVQYDMHFTVERAEASERIMHVTAGHQEALYLKMRQLGVA